MSAREAPEPQQHPLFPAKSDDEDAPQVTQISIARWNIAKGRNEYVPRMFAAEEIHDLSAISALFGGGQYELISRYGNRITARRQYDIAGEPRPLVDEPPRPAPPLAAPALQQHAHSSSGGPPGWVLGMLPMLLPIVLEYLKSAASERQAQQVQTNQMMIGVMQTQQSSSQAFITALSNLHASHGGNGGGGGRADFMAGIEFMENLLNAKMEEAKAGGGDDESQQIIKTIGQAFEGLKMLQGGGGVPGGTGGAAA
jgi:hypothetical protein